MSVYCREAKYAGKKNCPFLPQYLPIADWNLTSQPSLFDDSVRCWPHRCASAALVHCFDTLRYVYAGYFLLFLKVAIVFWGTSSHSLSGRCTLIAHPPEDGESKARQAPLQIVQLKFSDT